MSTDMRSRPIRACAGPALVLLLAACGAGGLGDDGPVRTGPNPIRPIYSGDGGHGGVDGDGGAPSSARTDGSPAGSRGQPGEQRAEQTGRPPPQRGGGSSPPPYGARATQPPAIVRPPGAPSSTDATASFKRDLLAPKVQDLQTKDALGRASPFEQRELMMKRQELHRLQTDPLRQ